MKQQTKAKNVWLSPRAVVERVEVELLGEKKTKKKKSAIQKRERKYLYVCVLVCMCRGVSVCVCVCVIKVVGHAATLKQKQQHVGRE